MDETGLYIKNFGRKSYIVKGEDNGKSIKSDKTRITLCVGFNCYGEELPPLMIGKSKNPRAFKNEKPQMYNLLYANNTTSWLTKDLFIKNLNTLNASLVDSERKILLLLDNFVRHNVSGFSNIKLLFFHPNTTSVLQPLDLGVISDFKKKYSEYVKYFINAQIIYQDANMKTAFNSLNLLDVCNWVRESIKNIKPATFYNCWAEFYSMKEKLSNQSLDNSQIEQEIDNDFTTSIQNLIAVEENEYDDSLCGIDEIASEIYDKDVVESNNFYLKKLGSVIKSENTELIKAFIKFKYEFLKAKLRLN